MLWRSRPLKEASQQLTQADQENAWMEIEGNTVVWNNVNNFNMYNKHFISNKAPG